MVDALGRTTDASFYIKAKKFCCLFKGEAQYMK